MSKVIEHCGRIAIIGRTNVGKSTLLNHLLGQKLSITSHKPQTTRHSIIGIKTINNHQMIFIDTPGLYQRKKQPLYRYMNRLVYSTLPTVDIILVVIEALVLKPEDERILSELSQQEVTTIIVINKIDRLKQKSMLLPYLDLLHQKFGYQLLIPISATQKIHVDVLEKVMIDALPENSMLFHEDQITDCDERLLVAELIREKLHRTLHEEIPFSLMVEIETFEIKDQLLHISAIIWVPKERYKHIVIGESGKKLKYVGQTARIDIENLLGIHVYLKLWTKVSEKHLYNENFLRRQDVS